MKTPKTVVGHIITTEAEHPHNGDMLVSAKNVLVIDGNMIDIAFNSVSWLHSQRIKSVSPKTVIDSDYKITGVHFMERDAVRKMISNMIKSANNSIKQNTKEMKRANAETKKTIAYLKKLGQLAKKA